MVFDGGMVQKGWLPTAPKAACLQWCAHIPSHPFHSCPRPSGVPSADEKHPAMWQRSSILFWQEFLHPTGVVAVVIFGRSGLVVLIMNIIPSVWCGGGLNPGTQKSKVKKMAKTTANYAKRVFLTQNLSSPALCWHMPFSHFRTPKNKIRHLRAAFRAAGK